MLKRLHPTSISARALAVAVLLALLATVAPPAEAKGKRQDKKKQPTTGRVEISTTPGGYPVIIDGVAAGETTEYVRAIELEPGEHTVEIIFPDNTRWQQTFNVAVGRRFCVALNYRKQSISVPAVPASPCPYPVNVSAPASASDGDIITFSADVGYAGPSGLNYTWTVSPPTARILTGAGTPTITVDSAGLGGRRLTAILVVDDGSGDRACRQSSQAQTNIIAQRIPEGPKRFDEFPSVAFDDDKARLDNLAIELQNSPGAQGYVIAYAGRRSRAGEAERMGDRAVKYLTETRGISRNRLIFVNGGYRESNSYELWLVPQGADAPSATPTLSPSDLRRGITPRRTRE
jgi:hypothetical protein